MSTLRTRILLKEAIRQILVEDPVTDYESFASDQEAAQKALDAVLSKKKMWNDLQAKRARGESLTADERKFLIKHKSINPIEKDVKRLSAIASETGAGEYVPVGIEKTEANAELPDKKDLARKIIDVSEITSLEWYGWNDPLWVNAIRKIRLGTIKDSDADRTAGVGPGEERLARIFGGKVQGGSVSFDVVTGADSFWEVKGLAEPTSTIRPGREGREVWIKPAKIVTGVLNQVENFIRIVNELGLDLDVRDRERMKWLADFQKKEQLNYERGEIPEARRSEEHTSEL